MSPIRTNKQQQGKIGLLSFWSVRSWVSQFTNTLFTTFWAIKSTLKSIFYIINWENFYVVPSIVYLKCLSCAANQFPHQSYVDQFLFSDSFFTGTGGEKGCRTFSIKTRASEMSVAPGLTSQTEFLKITYKVWHDLIGMEILVNSTKHYLNTISYICAF